MRKKRCLLVRCKDIVMEDIIWGIMESGHDCDCFDINCSTLDSDETCVASIKKYISANPADIVLSMNFSPTISIACRDLSIPYASWIYDCPLQSLYNDSAYNTTNYFFIFDKYLLNVCKERALPNLYYLPLAANISRLGQTIISENDEKEYSCDISFVGMPYVDGRYSFYRNNLATDFQDELDSAAYGMIGKWDGRDHIHNILSDELIYAMSRLSAEDPGEKLNLPNRLYFEEVIIARAVAYTERKLMMEKISHLNPRWYGANVSDNDKIQGVSYYPWLSYQGTLPKAYYLSKINLSSSLHSIFSGLPLRVFDIIGSGGFILTNYQPEIEELFDIGKEIVVYHNFDEMSDLAGFFLTHESERLSILTEGYKKICDSYTYPVAVSKIISRVFR